MNTEQTATTHKNRLAQERSPYLKQHAENPVNWFPWCDEAFALAKREDKPVLVSLGYSACHWCHVMAHESFEDEATADIMNRHFVNIKVDIEERPDIDKIYMNFVQMTTGRGGWPLNVFVTPDKVPFFGGTYFPPNPRYGMPSWQQILLSVADAWQNRRRELLDSGKQLLEELRKFGTAQADTAPLSASLTETAFNRISRTFDRTNGGFGGAPKFPPTMVLEFFLNYYFRTGEAKALEIAQFTGRKMAAGGIYDHLGGGFHRYAVDAVWLVPHFEKMLYDNAQLLKFYLHLYQISGEGVFARVARETCDYLLREMFSPDGGFYSSQDADSLTEDGHSEEGRFYVWTAEEIRSAIGSDEAALVGNFYGITEEGNFEGKNILYLAAKQFPEDLSEADRIKLGEIRQKLLSERDKRPKPFRDEKVITAWNGLAMEAVSLAAAVFDDQDYRQAAIKNAGYLLEKRVKNEENGGIKVTRFDFSESCDFGFIDDYANLANGLIAVYQLTGKAEFIEAARAISEQMISAFWDKNEGGFFYTAEGFDETLVRNKEIFDNAMPSGNSAAALALLKLSRFYSIEKFERIATTAIRAAAEMIRAYPNGFGCALEAAEFYLTPGGEVVLSGKETEEFERVFWGNYLPNTIFIPRLSEIELPPFEGRERDRKLAYVCKNYVCSKPAETIESFLKELEILRAK